MGNKEWKFIEAFQGNINTRHQRTVNESSVGQAIEIFVSKEITWQWKNEQWRAL